jgi:hypothetical protein
MKNIAVILFLVCVAAQVVFADPVLSINLNVYKNGSVVMEEIAVIDERPTFYIKPGDYRLEVKDIAGNTIFNQSINVNFWIMTDPPTPIDMARVWLKVGYTPEMKQINLFDSANKLVFSGEINPCNNNGICDSEYESTFSCPVDCPDTTTTQEEVTTTQGEIPTTAEETTLPPQTTRPGTTTTVEETQETTTSPDTTTTLADKCGNGVCDSTESFDSCPRDCSKPTGPLDYLPYIVIIVILLVILFVVKKKLDEKKIAKEKAEFEKWKQEKGGSTP